MMKFFLEIDVVLESIYLFLTHPHPSLRDTFSRKREKGNTNKGI
jgi:hypothetical protein